MDGLKARLSFDAVAYDYDDEYLTIDTDTHTININNVSRLFGVQYDGNSKLIKFRIRNKLSDIQKMQDSIVYINWIDSKGVKGQSIAINKTISNDICEFAWKVPFDALKNSGVLHFAMSAVITENNSSVINQKWSTQIASVTTPDGIYIKSYTPSSEEEDRIAQIYNELSKMINKQNDNLQSQVNLLNEALIKFEDYSTDMITSLYEHGSISSTNGENSSFNEGARLRSKEIEKYTYDVTIIPDGTVFFYVVYYQNGVFTNAIDWTTQKVTISKNQQFRLVLTKAQGSSEQTDANEILSHFKMYAEYGIVRELQPKTIYIAPNGNDENDGLTKDKPMLTVNKVISKYNDNITIIPANGTYDQQIYVENKNYIKIAPLVNSTNLNVIFTRTSEQNGHKFALCNHVELCNITFDGSVNAVMEIASCQTATVSHCTAKNSKTLSGFKVNQSNAVFNNCEGSNNELDGFGISGICSTVFNNCVGHDNKDDGISHHLKGCKGYINGGVFYNNGSSGIAPAYEADVNISNAVMYNNQIGVRLAYEGSTYTPNNFINSCYIHDNDTGISAENDTSTFINCVFDKNKVETSGGTVNFINCVRQTS